MAGSEREEKRVRASSAGLPSPQISLGDGMGRPYVGHFAEEQVRFMSGAANTAGKGLAVDVPTRQ